jgi:hypothetical protein
MAMSFQRCRFQRRFIATALHGFAPNCAFRAAATGLQKTPVLDPIGLISLIAQSFFAR